MFGLVLSLVVLTALMRADFTMSGEQQEFAMGKQEVVHIEEIKQTEQTQKPPPPPRPPVPVEVANDVIFEEIELDLDATLDLDAEVSDVPPPPPAPVTDDDYEAEIFIVVEQMPEIIGGTRMVYQYLKYPQIAIQAGIEGLVVIQIVVDAHGIPNSPEVVRSAGQVLDEAATSAVMQLRFVPGKQRGKSVKVRLAVPIRFRLRDAKPAS